MARFESQGNSMGSDLITPDGETDKIVYEASCFKKGLSEQPLSTRLENKIARQSPNVEIVRLNNNGASFFLTNIVEDHLFLEILYSLTECPNPAFR